MFLSWDEDGGGTIDEAEIIKPLVSLGLAPDSKFARKICQALDPRTKLQKARDETIEMTLEDFVRIFKNDKISDTMMAIIERETDKRHPKL